MAGVAKRFAKGVADKRRPMAMGAIFRETRQYTALTFGLQRLSGSIERRVRNHDSVLKSP